jgi:hypothetical protein
MSVSIAILKVLSAYEGRASYASLKASLEILNSPEWLGRMRTLGRKAGQVHLFSRKLATRNAEGWAITAEGRAFLERLETEEEVVAHRAERPELRVVVSNQIVEEVEHKPTALKVVRSA